MSKQVSVGAALQYARSILGGPVQESESVTAVNSTPVIIAKGNGDRVAIVIINLGAGDSFVAFSGTPSASRGILLSANGGNVAMTVVYDFTLVTREFSAVTPSGGPSNIYVLEISRYALDQAGA